MNKIIIEKGEINGGREERRGERRDKGRKLERWKREKRAKKREPGEQDGTSREKIDKKNSPRFF